MSILTGVRGKLEEEGKRLENAAKTAAQERFDSKKNELEPLMEKYADCGNPARISKFKWTGLREIRNDSGTIEPELRCVLEC